MEAITNIFDPKFDFTAIPRNRRLIAVDKLSQAAHKDNLITHEEFLEVLVVWMDQVTVAEFKALVK